MASIINLTSRLNESERCLHSSHTTSFYDIYVIKKWHKGEHSEENAYGFIGNLIFGKNAVNEVFPQQIIWIKSTYICNIWAKACLILFMQYCWLIIFQSHNRRQFIIEFINLLKQWILCMASDSEVLPHPYKSVLMHAFTSSSRFWI